MSFGGRCQREWRHGCELASRGGKGGRGESCQVVVAAVGKCSRPEQLKNFLYLDFINRDKSDYVLKKLVDTISKIRDCTVHVVVS